MTEPYCPVPVDNTGPRLHTNQYCVTCGRPSPCPRCSLVVLWGDGIVEANVPPLDGDEAQAAGRLLQTAGRQACLR